MALSQIQSLNEHHVNLRINESKPEFLYSEDQRLAVETLLDEGPNCFHDFIKTNQIRPFLSDLELAHLSASVEPHRSDLPDYPAGFDEDSRGTHGLSLQYWPERSDDSLPQLELGWPQRASYRGVTRVAVHVQPPLHGDAHIKEVIRRTVAQAQKVIAVVMDVFTDVDIFKDILHASYKRNVAVYIILEATGVPHFLKMCESATMHTGHLKNLRVRSIRGTGFFTHSSKRVYGSQSQKFMFVDGDKAISGSYSFTWTASRLDRSISTVLTGQAVDLFDQLFQDLYMMSHAVNLTEIHLEKEQKLESISKATAVLPPSTTMALKLINPIYALVSGNHGDSEMCTAKSNSIKQMKEVPEGPSTHPGLLYLEKANLIDYLPVWPEPDPPSKAICFINIKDSNKPFQAYLTRSELFEVSHVIQFKDPVHMPQESLVEKVWPRPNSPTAASANEQHLTQLQCIPLEDNKHCSPPLLILPPVSLEEHVVIQSSITNLKIPHSSKKDEKDLPVDHGLEEQTDILPKNREEKVPENIIANTSAEPCKESPKSDNPQIHNTTPTDRDISNRETSHSLVGQPEPSLEKLCESCENIAKAIRDKDIQGNQLKLMESRMNEIDHVDAPVQHVERTNCNSTSPFSSKDYFECSESVMFDCELGGIINTMPLVSRCLDEPNPAMESLSLFMSASSCEVIKEREECRLQSASPEEYEGQNLTGVTPEKAFYLEFMSVNEGNGLSESVLIANKEQIQQTNSTSQQVTESKVLHHVQTHAQVTPDENTKDLQESGPYSVINQMFDVQPVGGNNGAESQLLVNKSLLQEKVAMVYVPVQKTAEAQCIVFSDTVNKVSLLRLKSESNYTSSLKSVLEMNDDTPTRPQSRPVSLHSGFQKDPNNE